MKVIFANYDVTLTPQGAIWIEDMKLLCVADLHFEKDSFFNRFATFLPPYGSLETLHRLEELVKLYKPSTFIAAGDSFHDKYAAERMKPEVAAKLNSLIATVKHWHWITGNHDPAIAANIKGERSEEIQSGGITFRHKTLNRDEWEISGHYHPKTRFSIRGHFFSTACFVQHNKRLFLPAYGEYTGGLNIDSEAFSAVVPQTERTIYPIYKDRVLNFKSGT